MKVILKIWIYYLMIMEVHNYLYYHFVSSSFLSYKNFRVKRYGKEFLISSICSISKSKEDNKYCHLTKICFETKFLTSFFKTLLAALQYVFNKNDFKNKSS